MIQIKQEDNITKSIKGPVKGHEQIEFLKASMIGQYQWESSELGELCL